MTECIACICICTHPYMCMYIYIYTYIYITYLHDCCRPWQVPYAVAKSAWPGKRPSVQLPSFGGFRRLGVLILGLLYQGVYSIWAPDFLFGGCYNQVFGIILEPLILETPI